MSALLALLLSAGCVLFEPPPPDVMVVVLDTVRADRLKTYGGSRSTSNQLDAIADAGVVFHDVTASGTWTWPSHAALFTGEPPWVSGAHWSSQSDTVDEKTGFWTVSPMRTDLPTLAERFDEAGYRTVSLASNSLLDPKLGLTRGFDRAEWLKRDESVVEAVKALLSEPDPRPLFLFVNLMAAHAPYTLAPAVPWSNNHRRMLHSEKGPDWVKRYRSDRIPPALALGQRPGPGQLTGEEAYAKGTLKLTDLDLRFIEDLYDGELVRLDLAMVEIVGAWNRSGRGSGIMAVTSDHGEYLGEHGLIGHGIRVFDEVTRVPLVIAAPGRLEQGVAVHTPVQLRDLYPTLLDLAGIEKETPGSLVAVAGGAPREGPILSRAWPMPVFSRNVGGRYAQGQRLYREGSTAFVVGDDGQGTLFSLAADRSMTIAVQEDLAPWAKKASTAFPEATVSGAVTVPDEALQQLKALGYME